MKKIIITREQLKEAMNVTTPGLANNFQKDVNTQIGDGTVVNALKGSDGEYSIQNMDPAAKNGKDVTIITNQNGLPQQSDINSLANLNPNKKVRNVKFQKPITNTNTTAPLEETYYSKKQIEEVRGISNVMTKRALEESWGRWDGNLDNFFEEFQQRKYHYEMMYNDFMRGCEIIEQQLKLAVELVKEELQDMGLQMTNMNVRYDDEEVEITMSTNWILKGGDFDENEEDYRRYKYLSNIGDRRTSEIDIQLEDNANWQDNSKPINPYFTIKCNLPQIGNNDEY